MIVNKFNNLSAVKQSSLLTLVNQVAVNGLQLVSNLILTRLLIPEHFGLMALVNVFVIGLNMFSDLGIDMAVIQKTEKPSDKYLNTAWSLQITRGFLLFILATMIASPLSNFYEEPQLAVLIPLTALSAIVLGFLPITLAISSRNLNLKMIYLAQILAQTFTIIITGVLAYYYRSVLVLACSSVFSAFIVLYLHYKWQPKFKHQFKIDKVYFKEMFHFGKWIFMSTVFTFITGKGIMAIQGTLITVVELGLLHIAGVIAWAPGTIAGGLLGKVVFPALSEKNRISSVAFSKQFKLFKFYFLIPLVALCLILSLSSQAIIDLLYDDRYAQAGLFLMLMSLNAAIALIPMVYQNALLSLGLAKQHSNVVMFGGILKILGVYIGYFYYDIVGMLVGLGFANLLAYFFALSFAIKHKIKNILVDMILLLIIFIFYYIAIYELN
jgi:O-antigen/teichoic acid export membrane protein